MRIARILFGISGLLLLSGCYKPTYDDGPLVSMLTKEQRLCREWQINELNDAPFPTNTTWDFEEDGDLDIITNDNGVNTSNTWYWFWNSDKSGIVVSNFGGTEIDISKLSRNKLHFDINGDEYTCTSNN